MNDPFSQSLFDENPFDDSLFDKPSRPVGDLLWEQALLATETANKASARACELEEKAFHAWTEAHKRHRALDELDRQLKERQAELETRERLLAKQPIRRIPLRTRRAVMERDNGTCKYCGCRDAPTIDHIFPFSLGGTHDMENLQILCRSCNSRKHTKLNYTPSTEGMT